jgi:prolyl oligopeptidase
MAVGGRYFSEEGNLDFVINVRTFFDTDYLVERDGKLVKLDIPRDAQVLGYFKKQLLIQPRTAWKIGDRTHAPGTVLIGGVKDLLAGKKALTTLLEPAERLSVRSVDTTRNTVLVTVLDNVVSKLYRFRQDSTGAWQRKQVKTPANGTLSVFNTSEKSDDFFMVYENFLVPDSLYMIRGKNGKPDLLKSLPPQFEASPYQTLQYEAVSKDGTKVPYFIVMRKDVEFDGSNPTVLHGYGGFMVTQEPSYLGAKGEAWLARGGIWVEANIRGGGEFGPGWHQAALQKNRHKSFEDFIAVAEDLIARKITTPRKLAIQGGSNGGLLVGAVFLMRPELFRAVVCQAPLLDMKRYAKLLAGASWVSEYGDPDDPEMWEYIKTYSPYHNLKKDAKYPVVLFTTSTRDDRVHPGHTRKMAARMQQMGHEFQYYENIEGGHAGAANNEQRAYMGALAYAFLYQQLM